MTPEEIAALRRMATTGGLVSLTAKELSTILLERDHHAAEAKALREAARALVAALGDMEPGPVACYECYALATRHDEYVDQSYCDDHQFRFEVQTPMTDLAHAAPLRALRALLGVTP